MKKTVFFILLHLIGIAAIAQKAAVDLVITRNTNHSDWQILDANNTSVLSGASNSGPDTIKMNLDANRYYFLRISISEITGPDTTLYTLIVNSEPVILVKSLVGQGDHLLPFFTGTKALNAKITGGTTALISDYPWQVYFISGNFRCGGSIINGNWVITAGHCTKNSTGVAIPASQMSVKVGANNPSDPSQGTLYQVSRYIIHEGYDDQTLLDDIALLQLKDTISFTNSAPINLITAEDVAAGAITPGVLSWVTGWGLTSVNPNVVPTALQKVQLPIVSNAVAATVWGNSITATDLMAGYLNGNKDACNGDSGGPLIVPVSGEYKLAGIVSWGSTACNTYGAYTRVSDFDGWILKNTGLLPVGDSVICQGLSSSKYSIASIPGATNYQWELLPSSAGGISANGRSASVAWNTNYNGKATLIVKATIDNKTSDWYRLYIRLAQPTTLLGQSADTVICAGSSYRITARASGYNLVYTWSKNGQVVQSGTLPYLSISSATGNDAGNYQCSVQGACGSVTTTIIRLSVYPVTKITSISPDTEVGLGNTVSLQVTSEGHDLTYDWTKNGAAIGVNSAILTLSKTSANDIGIYRCKVSGTCGTQTSDSVYVFVKRADFSTEPEIFLWPSVTSNQFSVALNKDLLYDISIFSSAGSKIRDLQKCRFQTSVDISTLAKGLYIVEISGSGFRKSIKVIKE